ncbi:CLUMA_CG011619, isoform A [Clunio marinus]|uniref:CLUMA_CG011619, isoform A n=1 Tax=Clunio marinus TaxID=568069 RepID=A0A1J1IIH1_9DIPT|nr:CLUMA_CG011619, isoform A [Clunio marinus]
MKKLPMASCETSYWSHVMLRNRLRSFDAAKTESCRCCSFGLLLEFKDKRKRVIKDQQTSQLRSNK